VRSIAVIGCGFGDEGKGRVVDYLCHENPGALVVRFSGGHQAGHHVIRGGVDHVFSNFGSGSLAGAPTYWSKYCTVDPVGIANELAVLREAGVEPMLYIDERCPVTTPFDKLHNRALDAGNKHGSCGVGFGATLQRESDRYSLLFADLFNSTVLGIKLGLIQKYYGFSNVPLEGFMECCKDITISEDGITSVRQRPREYKTLIFEGSQGLLLDQDYGFFPHVTRANTGTKNVLERGLRPSVYLVTRAYQTRHGNGPMTNLGIPHCIKENPYEKNDYKGFQGEFRKSLLDIDLLKYAVDRDDYIRKTVNKKLVITCLDLVEDSHSFTARGSTVVLPDADTFAEEVGRRLGIKEVLKSKAPFGGLIPLGQ